MDSGLQELPARLRPAEVLPHSLKTLVSKARDYIHKACIYATNQVELEVLTYQFKPRTFTNQNT